MNNKGVYPFYTHIVHLRFKDDGKLVFWSDISDHPFEYRILLLDISGKKRIDTLVFQIRDGIFQLSVEGALKDKHRKVGDILFWSIGLNIKEGKEVQDLLSFLKRRRNFHELEGHLWIIVEDMKCLLLKRSDWKGVKDWSLGYLSLFSIEDIKDYSWEVMSKRK